MGSKQGPARRGAAKEQPGQLAAATGGGADAAQVQGVKRKGSHGAVTATAAAAALRKPAAKRAAARAGAGPAAPPKRVAKPVAAEEEDDEEEEVEGGAAGDVALSASFWAEAQRRFTASRAGQDTDWEKQLGDAEGAVIAGPRKTAKPTHRGR